MLKPDGQGIYFDCYGLVREHDTYQCGHCQRVTRLKPREHPEFSCKSCMGWLCLRCYTLLRLGKACRPFEAWLEMKERALTDAIERHRSRHGAPT